MDRPIKSKWKPGKTQKALKSSTEAPPACRTVDSFPCRDKTRRPMTTANKITILRILLVPFFIMQVLYYADARDPQAREWYRLAALLTFALVALSDALDGYIARRYNQRSELGAILDPLADKLLLVSAIVLLSRHDKPGLDRIPFWLAMMVIGRDAILLLGLIIIH